MIAVASDTFRGTLHYRRDCFLRGLSRCGFVVDQPPKASPTRHDVLLLWNRSPSDDVAARRYEAAGARVVVAENGYVGADAQGGQLYAIALGFHLGAGTWQEGPTDRWAPLGIEMKPWRRRGNEIVVLPQRGIGTPGIAMPRSWTPDIEARLGVKTKRPIRLRHHPGKERPDPWPDLQNAWAAVTWASGAGIKAIIHGIPVFHELQNWIGAAAARHGIEDLEHPFLGDRLPMLRRLAWAQWSLADIEAGVPFGWLLG